MLFQVLKGPSADYSDSLLSWHYVIIIIGKKKVNFEIYIADRKANTCI